MSEKTIVSPRAANGLSGAWLGFVLLVLIWAYNWVVAKNVLQFAGAFDFAALRSAAGVVTLFIILLLARRPLKPPPLIPTAVLGLLQTCGYMLLMNLALVGGGAGKVAVLAYSMPFWTLFCAWLALQERIRGLQWLAILLAFAGMWVIVDPFSLQGSLSSKLLALGAGLAWALATVYAKWLRRRLAFDVLSMTAWQMAYGTFPLLLLAWWMPQPPLRPEPYFWFALAYAGVLASGFGWWMWMHVLQRMPAGTVSLNALAIPVLAVLAAWVEHGERPLVHELAGMSMVAVALGLLSWITLQHQRQGARHRK